MFLFVDRSLEQMLHMGLALVSCGEVKVTMDILMLPISIFVTCGKQPRLFGGNTSHVINSLIGNMSSVRTMTSAGKSMVPDSRRPSCPWRSSGVRKLPQSLGGNRPQAGDEW